MSKKFTNSDPYDADLDAMWAMIGSQDYWTQKYESMGAKNVRFDQFDAGEAALTITSQRDVPADLPGFAKKIIGETNHVTQTERWTRSGDSAHCEISIEVKNVPGGTSGTMDMRPSGSGVVWDADFDIKISLPLVGGKLEGVMLEETRTNFTTEKAFNDSWLASH
jgi:hypothetical protein